ncbi:pyridoxamine 5'-phosphate oxidase family protein [Streptomyces sp. ISL-36]|uniref:pyridoxamine 5'-phosphate oxidase family protein n=1 Tax=Streptomyces sp. ISL-36 TaxID=2819182 RepID=UPI001BECD8D4|nr:pyridoxamine 5'-phosphate oxidase family protein [Streptomyces sp. ISL-36]MBT2445252.1 pyridoxamine 5'-phosphate oxidase family protein [Streptomyces sp. ISL-36]
MGNTGDAPHTWSTFAAAEPDLAATVRERFGRYTHHTLATVRKDGSPRLTGLEVNFRFDELWLAMMPNSRKALDLRRDPRFSLLANPGGGTEMDGGDVRISGRAVEVTDAETFERFAEEVGAPPPFHLFQVAPTEIVRTSVEDDELVVRTWVPGRPVKTIRRGNDDRPPRQDS